MYLRRWPLAFELFVRTPWYKYMMILRTRNRQGTSYGQPCSQRHSVYNVPLKRKAALGTLPYALAPQILVVSD